MTKCGKIGSFLLFFARKWGENFQGRIFKILNTVHGYPECGLAKPPGGSLPKYAGIGAGTAGAWGYILA